MNAYNRKAQDRKNRAFIMDEARALMGHSDLVALNTLHDVFRFGRFRLDRFYRGFQDTYDDYKRRYLAADDSTICGERIDTEVLTRHLLQIGFDYDALVDRSYLDAAKSCVGKTNQLRSNRAIVLEAASTVMEHADLVALVTLHDLEGFGRIRLERYFLTFQKEYNAHKQLYLAADARTIGEKRADTEVLRQNLLRIGFDYDALVDELVSQYRDGGDSV